MANPSRPALRPQPRPGPPPPFACAAGRPRKPPCRDASPETYGLRAAGRSRRMVRGPCAAGWHPASARTRPSGVPERRPRPATLANDNPFLRRRQVVVAQIRDRQALPVSPTGGRRVLTLCYPAQLDLCQCTGLLRSENALAPCGFPQRQPSRPARLVSVLDEVGHRPLGFTRSPKSVSSSSHRITSFGPGFTVST